MAIVYLLVDHLWSDDDHHYSSDVVGVFGTFDCAASAAEYPIYAANEDDPEDRSAFDTIRAWRVGDLKTTTALLTHNHVSFSERARRKENERRARNLNAVAKDCQRAIDKAATPEAKRRAADQALAALARQRAQLQARTARRRTKED